MYSRNQMTTHAGSQARPSTVRGSRATPGRLRTRPHTATSTIGEARNQKIICGLSESRGVSPAIGLVFVNLGTSEAVISQIVDHQTYVRTLHKLSVYEPSEILIPNTHADASTSKLVSVLEANLDHNAVVLPIERRFYNEVSGMEYLNQYSLKSDVEALKVSLEGKFFAICSLAAVFKYIDVTYGLTFAFQSMRIRYEPSEGTATIDVGTIRALELVQNSQSVKSKDSLFGLLNQTITPMGARLLRSNILQPSTDPEIIHRRFDAIEELLARNDCMNAVRQALKVILDIDRTITDIILIKNEVSLKDLEQSINQVILLKQCTKAAPALYQALLDVQGDLLASIQQCCEPSALARITDAIDDAINNDVCFQSRPLELRNQRAYAVKAGTNGLLDVARQAHKEAVEDAHEMVANLSTTHQLVLEVKWDATRQFYITIPLSDLQGREFPPEFINIHRGKKLLECQTLDLVKLNLRIIDSHNEVLQMSDNVIQQVLDTIRADVSPLFKYSEGIAMLDMLCAFASVATMENYVRPVLTNTLAIKAGRHPLKERICSDRYIPNDVYAAEQSRFQILTGSNMSGKSSYARMIFLLYVMAQIGSFVPAEYAAFSIRHEFFARVSTDDSVTANVSTFAAEMREMAYILGFVSSRSLILIDELGRGSSNVDGLAIAIAIAEALTSKFAMVWFITHFRQLALFLCNRPGVVNLHMQANLSQQSEIVMTYKLVQGLVGEEPYGIALAKALHFPATMLESAERVSQELRQKSIDQQMQAIDTVYVRRRRLVLGLKEQLDQGSSSNLEGEVLKTWLRGLRAEFLKNMEALDAEERMSTTATSPSVEQSETRTGSNSGYMTSGSNDENITILSSVVDEDMYSSGSETPRPSH